VSHPSEDYILGTLLNFGEGLELCDKLDSRSYSEGRLQIVWQAIRQLCEEGKPYTADCVHAILHREGRIEQIGGAAFLDELMDRGVSPATIHVHAKDLHNRAMVRELGAVGQSIAAQSTDDAQADHVIENAERDILALQSRRETRNEMSAKDAVISAMKTIQRRHEHGGVVGMPTGYRDLDEQLGGLQDGALYILAARPAMGKTCLALNMATHAAEKHAAAIFSLEMSGDELAGRLVSAQARVNISAPKSFGDAAYVKLARAQQELSNASLTIVDSSALTSSELRAHARKLHAQGKCKLLVVDYLQLMSGDGESREREIGEISRSLKLLAKELAIPVLALSQLNRGVESRQDKRPTLADLRDSGSIEQDADVVMFIYRDEVYNADSSDKGIAELIVSKNRHGPVGKVRLRFTPEYQRFDSML